MIQRITQIGIEGMTWAQLRKFAELSAHLPENAPVPVLYDESGDVHEVIGLAFYEEVPLDGGDR